MVCCSMRIHDHRIPTAKGDDLGVITVEAVCERLSDFGVYLVIVLQLGNLEHSVIRPMEDIRQPSFL